MSVMALSNDDGVARLLGHCRLLGEAEESRAPATQRLEAAIGRDRTRLLLTTLSGNHGFARRARRFRARSAP
jgi:hypothetical protein